MHEGISVGIFLRQHVPASLLRKFTAYYREESNLTNAILPTLHLAIAAPQNNIWLGNDYQLSIAKDGEEGINKALAEISDIIVCVIRMPKNDGFEVCATIKKDERTRHIPIIILTAKANDEARMRGLELGANAYLSKPFNQKELSIRLRKLHELRLQLQARYATLIPPTGKTSSRPKEPVAKYPRSLRKAK